VDVVADAADAAAFAVADAAVFAVEDSAAAAFAVEDLDAQDLDAQVVSDLVVSALVVSDLVSALYKKNVPLLVLRRGIPINKKI
jgi:hypothetical protein